MSYPKIVGQRVGETTHVIVDGETYSQSDPDGDIITAISNYNDLVDSGADPQDIEEKVEEIENYLNLGNYRSEVVEDLLIETEEGLSLKGTDVQVPERVKKIMETFEDKNVSKEAVVNFYNLLLLNPSAQSQDLFAEYILNHGVKITSEGYAVLYKSVREAKGENRELLDAVGREFMRVKDMKQSPARYNFFRVREDTTLANHQTVEEGYYSSKTDLHEKHESIELLGNLEEQYKEVTNKAHYRPHHRGGSYGNEIKLGEPVSMPRSKCVEDPNSHCNRGLHVGEKGYVTQFHRRRATNLAVLVNPKDVVSVPNDGHKKMRTCKYFPFAVLSKNGDDWKEISDELKHTWKEQEIEDLEEIAETSEGDKQQAAQFRLENIR